MSISQNEIQQLLLAQKYDRYVVTDIGRFPNCLPGRFNPSGKTLESKLIAVTPGGQSAYRRYIEWSRSYEPATPLRLLPPQKYSSFLYHVKQIDKRDNKEAECSNFAYHAIGVLLREPAIIKSYNVCLVGIMSGSHNIALLVPKELALRAVDIKKGILPVGTLLIDPWAVAVGYPVEQSLAVSQESFLYQIYLENMTVHYQSQKDPDVPLDAFIEEDKASAAAFDGEAAAGGRRASISESRLSFLHNKSALVHKGSDESISLHLGG